MIVNRKCFINKNKMCSRFSVLFFQDFCVNTHTKGAVDLILQINYIDI